MPDHRPLGHQPRIESLKPRIGVLGGQGAGVRLNFSGQSLNDDEFSDMLIERVATSGLDPELLVFELTRRHGF